MVDRVGNVLKVPGTTQTAVTGDDEVLGSYARFTQKGLTLAGGAQPGAAGVLEAGTLLALSEEVPFKYVGSTGVGDGHIGVLRKGVDASTTDMLANYIVSGIVKLGSLKYADGTAVPPEDYAAIATSLNGRIDYTHEYLIF